MIKRQIAVLILVCWLFLVVLPPFQHMLLAQQDEGSLPPRSPRILFIVQDDCPACDAELRRLSEQGGAFEAMERRGWQIGSSVSAHVQIVNVNEMAAQVEDWNLTEFPTVLCLEDEEIVRSFREGCSTPLDAYTFGWLLKGVSERPAPAIPTAVTVETTGHYPLRGNHWNFEGHWSPGHEFMVSHLRGVNHSHLYPVSWPIENWTDEELRSLHDDLHEMNRPRQPLDLALETGNAVQPGEAVPIYRPVAQSQNYANSGSSRSSSSSSNSSATNAAQKARASSGGSSSNSGSGRGFF